MLKFISTTGHRLLRLVEPRDVGSSDDRSWRADPLSHPDIDRMDARELADLPFPRGPSRRSADAGPACRERADSEACAA